MSVYEFRYNVSDNEVAIEAGYCDEIYNIDPTFQDENGNPLTNVSFYDMDEDALLSIGNVFYVRGVNNSEIYNNAGERVPGIGKEGLLFRLVFTPTGSTVGEVTLSDNVPINQTFIKHHPSNRWTVNTSTIKEPLNISTTELALSSYPPLHGQNVTLATTVYNNDSVAVSNITVKFFDNNIEIGCKENISIQAGNKTRILAYHYFDHSDIPHNITVEVMAPELWTIPLQAYCHVNVIERPPAVTTSFHINIITILLAVLISSLLGLSRRRAIKSK